MRIISSYKEQKPRNGYIDEMKRQEERKPISFNWAELDNVKEERPFMYE